MNILRVTVVFVVLISNMVSCGPGIDSDLRPFVRMKSEKDAALFLQKPIEEQIEIYLRVVALPLKPPDYSLSGVIAVRDGDIGPVLSDRIKHEKDVEKLTSLLRLAGQFCQLNGACQGEGFLEDSIKGALQLIPDWHGNPYISQNVEWVSERVNKAARP